MAGEVLVDTSVAVALTVADHEFHAPVFQALSGEKLGLAGHAAFETYSVLTRLPGAGRLSASAAARVVKTNFPGTRFVGAKGTATLLSRLEKLSISGGSVYDALVGTAATEHGLSLASIDRRAIGTYRAIGVSLMPIDLA